MVDVANPMKAAGAYANTAKTAVSGGGEAASNNAGVSFGSMLESAAKSSIDTIKAGEAAGAGAITGKVNQVELINAVSSAKLTLETVVAVRDNVVDAYNKIMQMPI